MTRPGSALASLSVRVCTWLLAALMLAGLQACAALEELATAVRSTPAAPHPAAPRGAGPVVAPAAAPAASSATPAAAAASAAAEARQAVRVEIEAPGDLKALLERHLDLVRLGRLPREEVEGSEWSRLIDAAPAQVRELLQTEGYFNP